MSKKKSFNWKIGVIALVAMLGIFAGLTAGIKNSNNFKVTHFEEVKSEYGPDGRAAVGSPEIYQVRISPALTWELSKNNTRAWRTIAFVLAFVFAGFVLLYGNGWISFGVGTNAPNYIMGAIYVAAFACYLAAYSSAFSNNYRDLSKDQYEAVKGDNAKMKALFTGKPYIR
ncbi:MAG: hypothetical protein ACT4OJ_06230 [Bacteroidota bacterium]